MVNALLAPSFIVLASVQSDGGLNAALLALAVGVIHAAAFEVRQWFKERKRNRRKPKTTKPKPTKSNG